MTSVVQGVNLKIIADYYSDKLAEHGDTPKGVDWNGEESQSLRFEQLLKVVNQSEKFSIIDFGCGYGAFNEFLESKSKVYAYLGIDISEDMISAAQLRFKDSKEARFLLSNTPDQVADYVVASGVFNVCLQENHQEWLNYIESTLDVLNQFSIKGFSFNCLTSYSDKEKMRDYLYYANPAVIFDLCKKRYSKNVALLHDYDLYEFTILVRK